MMVGLSYLDPMETEKREKIETIRKMIAAERQEIAGIREELRRKTGFLHALEAALATLVDSSDWSTASPKRRMPQITGRIARIVDFLRQVKEPQHLDTLIEVLGETVNREIQTSFRAQLGKYVNKHHLLYRPAPNMFGLIEWGEDMEENQPESELQVSMDAATPPPHAREG